MEKKFCVCGCGNEVKVWTNKRSSNFLRGHHMRCKKGCKNPFTTTHYCQCGCGGEIKPLPNGHVNKFLHNHHRKGYKYDLETRVQRMKSRWNKEPIMSPYLSGVFINQNSQTKRWYACIVKDGKSRNALHANAVYKEHYGEVPKGYVVHHKNGNHSKISDDCPSNLMLLLDEWNLRFFPVLAKGFHMPEKAITDAYLSIADRNVRSDIIFSKLCEILVDQKKKENEEIERAKAKAKSGAKHK
jgi:hypothetical protein